MNKAIFLDRDGVINKETGDYNYKPEDFIINEGVKEALQYFIDKNYLIIVITNQGGIGKGLYSKKDVEILHESLIKELSKEKITLTEIYYCPHHPSTSNCLCRKPDNILNEKALAKFNIDPATSYFIGDTDRDIQAAKKSGLSAIKIPANDNLNK